MIRFNQRMTAEQFEIVKRHSANVPVRLGALAEELGIVVRVSTLPHGKSGQIAPSKEASSGYTIKVNRHESKNRQRFTLAHEIAHFLLHKDKIGSGIYDSVLYRADGITNREEVEANQLAAEIIMPASAIRDRMQNFNGVLDEDAVSVFSSEFRVSSRAMEIRLGLH